MGNKNDDNYCFGWSSSANSSIKACCCDVSCQSSGITTEHSRFVSVSLSLCWHNGDDSSCSWPTIVIPTLSKSAVRQPPRKVQNQEKPPARLYVLIQDRGGVPDFQKALLTSYNRHHLSARRWTIGVINHTMRQILRNFSQKSSEFTNRLQWIIQSFDLK